MKATGRNRLVTLRRRTLSRDGNNQPVETWADLAQAWAEKLDISDGERLRAEQVGASMTTRFRMLWSPAYSDLNPKDEVLLAGCRYDIVGVKEIGRQEGLEVTAIAKADA